MMWSNGTWTIALATTLVAILLLSSFVLLAQWRLWHKRHLRRARARAEACVRDGEDRFRAFAEISADWCCEPDDGYRFTFISDSVKRHSGLEPREYLGKTPWEIRGINWTPVAIAKCKAKLDAHLAFDDFEYSRVDPHGEARWASLRGRPMFDADGRFRGYRGTSLEITDRKRTLVLERARAHVLQLLADGEPLPRVLEAIVIGLERVDPAIYCSILLLDADGARLRHGAGPRLPDFYVAAIDGIPIGHGVGSCGTAAFTGKRAVVEDIAVHPWWSEYRELAARAGLASCWSEPIRGAAGKVLGTFAIYRATRHCPTAADLQLVEDAAKLAGIAIDRARAAEALRESEERLEGIVDNAMEAIVLVNDRMDVVLFNRAAETVFGCRAREALGGTVNRFIPVGLRELSPGGARDVSALRMDGTEFPAEVSISKIVSKGRNLFSVVLRDVSQAKRDAQRLLTLAHYDELTGLPNRSLFMELLRAAITRAKRSGRIAAVVLIDVDRFTDVNEAFGHESGDQLLREVSIRLRGCLREGDTLARLGADEFAVLIQDCEEALVVRRIAHKLLQSMDAPFVLNGAPHRVTASIGISVCPADSIDASDLLRNAGAAMHRAKNEGRHNFRYYTEAMNAMVRERLSTENGLWKALDNGEFVLHYQPRVSFASGRVTGVEALLRWNRPGRGLAKPDEFIPFAEESGSILGIGLWVLRTACEQGVRWHRAGLPLRVAVNISALQFEERDLAGEIERVLQDSGLNAERLEIEITESVVMRTPESAVVTLDRLKAMGVGLTIDDFGTGYSSLGYLKRFPIDHVKIDRSFINEIPQDESDTAITRTIISMAHSLNMTTTAEGVETSAQWEFLRAQGCDEMQGFYFCEPVPAEEINYLLDRQQSPA